MGVRALPVRWAEPAEAALDRILQYIEAENPEVARRLWRRSMDAVEQAADFRNRIVNRHAETRAERIGGQRGVLVVRHREGRDVDDDLFLKTGQRRRGHLNNPFPLNPGALRVASVQPVA